MSAQEASLIITVLSFNGTAFGIGRSIDIDLPADAVPLQNQGQLGFGAIGIVALGGMCVVSWVAGAGAALFPRGTRGDIAYTSQDAVNGGTQARPLSDMVALGGKIQHIDRSHALCTQVFMNESDAGQPLGGGI